MKHTGAIDCKNAELPWVCSICLVVGRYKIMPDVNLSSHVAMATVPSLQELSHIPRARLCQAVPHLGLTSAWQRNLHCLPESCL